MIYRRMDVLRFVTTALLLLNVLNSSLVVQTVRAIICCHASACLNAKRTIGEMTSHCLVYDVEETKEIYGDSY